MSSIIEASIIMVSLVSEVQGSVTHVAEAKWNGHPSKKAM
jgi:hypothetical protein